MDLDRCFIDTNIFLRALIGDNARQTKACDAFFILLRTGRIEASTSSVVLAEVVWTGLSHYAMEKRDVIESVRSIVSMPHVSLDERTDLQCALDLYTRHTIKFVDALIASHPALQAGTLPLLSYDRDFDKLGVKRIEPDELVRLYAGQKRKK